MIEFGEYLPDLPVLENPGALKAHNVIPVAKGYTPFPQMAAYSGSLSAMCQGAFSTRAPDLTAYQFAGDNNKLYKLDTTTWSNVTRTLSVYATASDGRWYFTQFGNTIIAVNNVDEPQSYVMGTSTQFANLGGSPPLAAGVCATIREFVVLGRAATFPSTVYWSGFSDPTTWTADAITQAGSTTLPDGGIIRSIVGGEYGVVLQESAIRRMVYAGPPFTFQFDKISTQIGCALEGSVAHFENMTFFADASGFYMIHGGQDLVPIGNSKIDRFFNADIDPSYPHKVWSAVYPERKVYVVIYPGSGNSSGTPNRALLYNWVVKRWATADITAELIYNGLSQAGYNLDQLDPFGTLETLPYSFDSPVWAGVAKRLLAAFDTSHRLNYFNGANAAATLDTGEYKPGNGQVALIRAVRPIVDGGDPTVTLLTRNTQQDTAMSSAVKPVDVIGAAKFRVRARYARARVDIPASSSWTTALGIDDVLMGPEGDK